MGQRNAKVAPGLVRRWIHSQEVRERQEAEHARRVEILHDLGHTDTEGLDMYQTLVYYDIVTAGVPGDRETALKIIEVAETSPFDHIQIIRALIPPPKAIQSFSEITASLVRTIEETSELLEKIRREGKVSRKGHRRKSSREI